MRALPIFALLLNAAPASAQILEFPQDLAGFNAAAGTPPVSIDFDDLSTGTDIGGMNLNGVTFTAGSAALIVEDGNSTWTPGGFSGVIDPNTNRLFPTSGSLVLTPGGLELGPGSNPPLENDDVTLTFDVPIAAFGFDHLSQSADGVTFTSIYVFNASDALLFYSWIVISNVGDIGGGAPGAADFYGIVSATANIKKIVIEELDGDSVYPDCNIGIDTLRFFHETLAMRASPTSVQADETLTLTELEGVPGDPTLIGIVDVNGSPLWIPLLLDTIDAQGRYVLSATVPSGLSGITVGFLGFGFARSGRLVATNVEYVTFL